MVANSRGQAVRSFEGLGQPPREIAWDGRSTTGQPVQPGLMYSYVFEARDRAGNKRNFVGEGFKLSAYRLQTPAGPVLAFTGTPGSTASTRGGAAARRGATSLLLESASWINQSPSQKPVRVTATARSYEQANALATDVARELVPLLLGNPARVQSQVRVEPDACESGTLQIAPAP